MKPPHDHEAPEGRVFKPPVANLPWQAAYGLELMRICREADATSQRVGYFVPHVVPTEEEFKAILKSARRRKHSVEMPGGFNGVD